ncbi:hypothetical protein FGK60_32305 [Streptomyces sp. DASNCL29]|nr:hypothetical protein FGK60_32305 [Streptomyces sp. DASNCL29]
MRTGEVRTGEVRTGEVRTGEVRTGEVRTGEVRTRGALGGRLLVRSAVIASVRSSATKLGEAKCMGWAKAQWRVCLRTPLPLSASTST